MKNMVLNVDGVPTIHINDPAVLDDYLIIDVRRREEFRGELGHIQGAQLFTLGEELESFLNSEPKDRKILFVCRSGGRSGKATAQAMALGFKNVFNMEGGMISWNDKKFPTAKET